MNRRAAFGSAATLLLALALAPSSAMSAGVARVTGSVFYRERIALPPGAVARVELRDVSLQDAAAPLVAAVDLALKRQPPFSFSLRYDPRRIVPGHLYAVSARILVDGRLAFISTRRYPVLTSGAPAHVDILLQRVGGR